MWSYMTMEQLRLGIFWAGKSMGRSTLIGVKTHIAQHNFLTVLHI